MAAGNFFAGQFFGSGFFGVIVSATTGPTRKQHQRFRRNAEVVLTGVPVLNVAGTIAALAAGDAEVKLHPFAPIRSIHGRISGDDEASVRVKAFAPAAARSAGRLHGQGMGSMSLRASAFGTTRLGQIVAQAPQNPTAAEWAVIQDVLRKRRQRKLAALRVYRAATFH